jgi:hypothetical protein
MDREFDVRPNKTKIKIKPSAQTAHRKSKTTISWVRFMLTPPTPSADILLCHACSVRSELHITLRTLCHTQKCVTGGGGRVKNISASSINRSKTIAFRFVSRYNECSRFAVHMIGRYFLPFTHLWNKYTGARICAQAIHVYCTLLRTFIILTHNIFT